MAAGPMRKSEVIARVAEAADVSPRVATKMLEALTDLASNEAKRGFPLPFVKFRLSNATKEAILGKPRSSSVTTKAIPTIQALHDPETGRLDAVRVAHYLHESLAFMATALRRNYSTVAKTPAAMPLQERLRDFKRIIEVLEHVLGSAESMRIWMNTPHPDLDDETPRDVIASGKVAVVRGMIDSALSGNLS